MRTRQKVLWVAGGVVAVVALLALTGHKQVHAELVVPAPPAKVWSVLTDAGGYAQWNPVFTRVEGTYGPNAEMAYKMKDEAGKEHDVKARVIKFEEARELNQFGGMRGVMTFDHHWILEPTEGGTKVIQHEEYRGIGVWFWDPSWFQTAYAEANEALKKRVTGGAEAKP